jgi:hypothetical protein
MTMAIDNQQRFGGMNFDHMPYTNGPQFNDPWTSASSRSQTHNIYATHGLNLDGIAKQQQQQPQRMQQHVGSYANVPAASAGSPLLADVYGSQDLLTMSQDLLSPNRPLSTGYGNETSYSSAPSPVHSAYPPTSSPYESMGYAPAPVRSTYAIQQQDSRRLSQPSVPPPIPFTTPQPTCSAGNAKTHLLT